jgi:hypothetical protein
LEHSHGRSIDNEGDDRMGKTATDGSPNDHMSSTLRGRARADETQPTERERQLEERIARLEELLEASRPRGDFADLLRKRYASPNQSATDGATVSMSSATTNRNDTDNGNGAKPGVVSRSFLLKAALAGTAGAIGAAAAGSFNASDALAAPGSADYYTAYGADPSYVPDGTIGFDSSDRNAGFEIGVAGFGAHEGVAGYSDKAHAVGVLGRNFATTAAPTYGVWGFTQNGTGVRGSDAGAGTEVEGLSGTGNAMHAVTGSDTHSAIFGESNKGAAGVHATSQNRRGGVCLGRQGVDPAHA